MVCNPDTLAHHNCHGCYSPIEITNEFFDHQKLDAIRPSEAQTASTDSKDHTFRMVVASLEMQETIAGGVLGQDGGHARKKLGAVTGIDTGGNLVGTRS
jgi:hypothetical protein